MTKINESQPVTYNTDPVPAVSYDNNKKVKKFDAELQGLLTGNPPVYIAAMPDIGGLLGGKGTAHATTQV